MYWESKQEYYPNPIISSRDKQHLGMLLIVQLHSFQVAIHFNKVKIYFKISIIYITIYILILFSLFLN